MSFNHLIKSRNHSFNAAFAEKYGFKEAILYAYFLDILHPIPRDKMKRKWISITPDDIHQHLPFFSLNLIKSTIDNMLRFKLIKDKCDGNKLSYCIWNEEL